MKDKIIYLILGILIGAIITAGCFMIFSKNGAKPINGDMPRGNMENRVRGERPEGLTEPIDASATENNI